MKNTSIEKRNIVILTAIILLSGSLFVIMAYVYMQDDVQEVPIVEMDKDVQDSIATTENSQESVSIEEQETKNGICLLAKGCSPEALPFENSEVIIVQRDGENISYMHDGKSMTTALRPDVELAQIDRESGATTKVSYDVFREGDQIIVTVDKATGKVTHITRYK